MRIVVTGATGFVGGQLLAALHGDHELYAIVRGDPPAALRGLAKWIPGDLAGPIERLDLPCRVDAVVHLAQSKRYRDFPGGAADVFAVNVASTFGLLEYARRAAVTRFLHASTGGVYATSSRPLAEDAPLRPSGFYAASKAAAEQLARGYAGLMHVAILRPFFVYGPGQSGMLVATLTRRILDGEPVEVAGAPGLRLTPIFVDDAVRAFAAALAVDGSVTVNIAGDEAVTLTELVELIGTAAGTTPRIRHIDGPASADLAADNRAMRELLGAPPQTALRDGLRRTIAAARTGHGRPPASLSA